MTLSSECRICFQTCELKNAIQISVRGKISRSKSKGITDGGMRAFQRDVVVGHNRERVKVLIFQLRQTKYNKSNVITFISVDVRLYTFLSNYSNLSKEGRTHDSAMSMGGIFGLFGVHFGTASGECATQNDYLIKLCGFIGWMMRGERVMLCRRRGVRKHDNRQHGNYVRSWSFRWSWNIKQCHPIICTFKVDENSMVLVLGVRRKR